MNNSSMISSTVHQEDSFETNITTIQPSIKLKPLIFRCKTMGIFPEFNSQNSAKFYVCLNIDGKIKHFRYTCKKSAHSSDSTDDCQSKLKEFIKIFQNLASLD